MKILVDADACPVKKEIVSIAKELDIKVIMYIDTSHTLDDSYSQVVIVGKGKDAVDIVLVNNIAEGDIVVTQDYGLAAVVLSKKANAINQNGRIYNTNNIDRLLFERFLSQENRRAGKRGGKHKKRTKENNERFKIVFRDLCLEVMNKEK